MFFTTVMMRIEESGLKNFYLHLRIVILSLFYVNWQPTENIVSFADHSFERELESDLVYSLRTVD